MSSIVLLVAATERTLYKKSKHFFTIYGCVGIGILIVDIFIQAEFDIGGSIYRLTTLTQYFASSLLAIFIMVLYLRAALKATGTVKKNAIFMMFAIILFAVSELAHSKTANELLPVVELLAPLIMGISLVLLFYAVSRLSVWKKGDQKIESKDKSAELQINEE
ncbi:MAG: hypothetical protein ACFFCS_26060 [Candidatus Hodarchaeota archaeon]